MFLFSRSWQTCCAVCASFFLFPVLDAGGSGSGKPWGDVFISSVGLENVGFCRRPRPGCFFVFFFPGGAGGGGRLVFFFKL